MHRNFQARDSNRTAFTPLVIWWGLRGGTQIKYYDLLYARLHQNSTIWRLNMRKFHIYQIACTMLLKQDSQHSKRRSQCVPVVWVVCWEWAYINTSIAETLIRRAPSNPQDEYKPIYSPSGSSIFWRRRNPLLIPQSCLFLTPITVMQKHWLNWLQQTTCLPLGLTAHSHRQQLMDSPKDFERTLQRKYSSANASQQTSFMDS
jgi:hypothetical protein